MSGEFNIFKNLDDLKNTNLLDQLKALESAKTVDLNDSESLENDDFDFDSILNSNATKRSPTKRQQNNGSLTKAEGKLTKKSKSRRNSKSSNGSISPTLDFINDLSKKIDEMPARRVTRRSIEANKQIGEEETVLESIMPSSSKQKTRGKGKGAKKGGARGRGRGRGRNNTSSYENTLHNGSTETAETSQSISLNSSSNEALAHDDESSNYDSTSCTSMERYLQRGLGRQRVMRGRRRCLAERAARSTQVDYIDLVSSPMPRVEGFIDLDSDSEQPHHNTRSKKNQVQPSINSKKTKKSISESTIPNLDISFDEDNPEFNIKVNWKGKLETFTLRKHQKFSVIFEQLAERESISIDNIVFNLNDRIIMADDTPDTINYKIFHFIDGRVLLSRFDSPKAAAAAVGKTRDVNQITLKIQSDKWKRPLQINVMKTDKFRILYIKCAEELKVGVDQLKLSFDGELLELNDTPTDLDFEGGEAIDLRIKN